MSRKYLSDTLGMIPSLLFLLQSTVFTLFSSVRTPRTKGQVLTFLPLEGAHAFLEGDSHVTWIFASQKGVNLCECVLWNPFEHTDVLQSDPFPCRKATHTTHRHTQRLCLFMQLQSLLCRSELLALRPSVLSVGCVCILALYICALVFCGCYSTLFVSICALRQMKRSAL